MRAISAVALCCLAVLAMLCAVQYPAVLHPQLRHPLCSPVLLTVYCICTVSVPQTLVERLLAETRQLNSLWVPEAHYRYLGLWLGPLGCSGVSWIKPYTSI